MATKKTEIKLTANQELQLAVACESSYAKHHWNGKLSHPNSPALIGNVSYNSRKKFLLGEFIGFDNKLTAKGIKIGEEDYKVRTGKTFKQALKVRLDFEKKRAVEVCERQKELKNYLAGISVTDKNKKKSLYKVILSEHWFSPTHDQWIEIVKQFHEK